MVNIKDTVHAAMLDCRVKFKVNNISKLNKHFFGPCIETRAGMSFRTVVEPWGTTEDRFTMLGFFVICNWHQPHRTHKQTCKVNIELTICAQTDDGVDWHGNTSCTFRDTLPHWGLPEFIEWQELLRSPWIKDDSIVLQVALQIDEVHVELIDSALSDNLQGAHGLLAVGNGNGNSKKTCSDKGLRRQCYQWPDYYTENLPLFKRVKVLCEELEQNLVKLSYQGKPELESGTTEDTTKVTANHAANSVGTEPMVVDDVTVAVQFNDFCMISPGTAVNSEEQSTGSITTTLLNQTQAERSGSEDPQELSSDSDSSWVNIIE